MQCILKVQNLAKRFGTAEVLNDICFSLSQGEVVSIIGPSGATCGAQMNSPGFSCSTASDTVTGGADDWASAEIGPATLPTIDKTARALLMFRRAAMVGRNGAGGRGIKMFMIRTLAATRRARITRLCVVRHRGRCPTYR